MCRRPGRRSNTDNAEIGGNKDGESLLHQDADKSLLKGKQVAIIGYEARDMPCPETARQRRHVVVDSMTVVLHGAREGRSLKV